MPRRISISYGLFALVAAVALLRPVPAGGNGFEARVGNADSIQRGTLGQLDGRPLCYRKIGTPIAHYGGTRQHVQVFIPDDREAFEALPTSERRGEDVGEDGFEILPPDAIQVVLELYNSGTVPTWEPESGRLIQKGTSPAKQGRQRYEHEYERVYAWNVESGKFEEAYVRLRYPQVVTWHELLEGAERGDWARTELRALFIEPLVPTYYGASCDPKSGLVVMEVVRRRVESLLDAGRQSAAHQVVSAYTRYGYGREPPPALLESDSDAVATPLCGVVRDMRAKPSGYGRGCAWCDGVEISACGVEKDGSCEEAEVELERSGDAIRETLLNWAELAASRGDGALARWLTYAMPTAGYEPDSRKTYPLASAEPPDDAVAAERIEHVVDFADRQHEAGRSALAAVWERQLAAVPEAQIPTDTQVPSRIGERAARHASDRRPELEALPAWRDRLRRLLDDGKPARAVGELLRSFRSVAVHSAPESADAATAMERALPGVYRTTVDAIYSRATGHDEAGRTELAGLWAKLGLRKHPLAVGPWEFTDLDSDFSIRTVSGLVLPLTVDWARKIRDLRELR